MRYEDLNEYDQELLNTDFGEFEKEAAEKLAEADEVYAYGQEQAHAIADQMDYAMAKHAEEEEEDEEEEEEEMDEESEKKAAELGAFIERGLFDELTKLGSERHGDPLHYYYPYMEEKIAQMGAEEKLAGFRELVQAAKGRVQSAKGRVGDAVRKGRQWASEAIEPGAKKRVVEPKKSNSPLAAIGEKAKAHRERGIAQKTMEAIADYHKPIAGKARTGSSALMTGLGKQRKGMIKTTPEMRAAARRVAGRELGEVALRSTPHALAAGGVGYGAYRLAKGKKDKKEKK